MTFDECLEQYGDYNKPYCEQFQSQGSSFDIGSFFGSIFGNIPFWIALIIVIILVVMAIKVIRQKQVGVIERLGRYNRSLDPGFHMIIPFFERIVDRVDMRQYRVKVKTAIKTKDEQMVVLPVVVLARVTDAKDALYEVDDPDAALEALLNNEIKAKAATMTLQEVYDDRESMKETINDHLNQKIGAWGLTINEVAIDNPELSEEMEASYNSVAAAERAKQAAAANGAALNIKMIAEAEANGASLKIQGESYKLMRDSLAEGNAAAIKKLQGETDLTASEIMVFLTRIDSNDAVRDAAKSKGATVVVATGSPDHATLGMLAEHSK